MLILQTSDVRELKSYIITDSGDTIPDNTSASIPWEFRYSKGLFKNFVTKGYLDSAEAKYMFDQMVPNLTVTLDSTRLVRKGINFETLDAFFQERKRVEGFKMLHEKLGVQNFVRLSTPLISKNRSKALISMNNYCGRLCGGRTLYLLEIKDGNWQIIYKEVMWTS